MGESEVYRPGSSKATTDSGDTTWDINDPDIPARIEQYVSSEIMNMMMMMMIMMMSSM